VNIFRVIGDHRLALEQAVSILNASPDHPDFQLVSLSLVVDLLENAHKHSRDQYTR
jgi:hypothetical protein